MDKPTWYTCVKCAPHGMADHSIYLGKECLIKECPCKGYVADPKKPQIKAQSKQYSPSFTPK